MNRPEHRHQRAAARVRSPAGRRPDPPRGGWIGRSALACFLLAGAACGSGGGGGGDRAPDGTPTPGATTLPSATPTPALVGTATVRFTMRATAPLQAFQVRATYPRATGGFAGSGDAVECTATTDAVFTRNHRDDGTLVLSVAAGTALAFPIAIDCAFDVAAGALAAADVGVSVEEVTSGGEPGAANTLEVAVEVTENAR